MITFEWVEFRHCDFSIVIIKLKIWKDNFLNVSLIFSFVFIVDKK